ncbi:MAG: hypothetical protein KJ964_04645 [Verrucomicrobia bacterium]|nr:hypothetical protein [Verrucomicrobiota bacterium]MBU1733699.1 hypothetical protein [Verrucomicrobiota bacterium]MBU1858056.1 hypothetical protein [Verrucomicrobiota bacterium]
MDTNRTQPTLPADGIHRMVPRETMGPGPRKLRDAYAIKSGAGFYQKEFGYYCLENWKVQGMPQDVPKDKLFGYDPQGLYAFGGLGWTTADFTPGFDEALIEDRGELEVVRDMAGRHVLYFKGRRNGFMPEYIDHPVKDWKTWEDDVKWRLDPKTPSRYADIPQWVENGQALIGKGAIVTQKVIGGYMYLRSLMGPGDVLYTFHDAPDLIHDCMKTWFELADAIIAEHQKVATFDELFFGEDICYNHGPLISPDMMREFLLPYYGQLLTNMKARQIDKSRHLFFQIDTDGFAPPTIPIYRELGMDVMSPFEVASYCDVVEVGRQYPDLVISGGVDKRELAKGKAAIDRLVDRIFPVMQQRGGYIPTCDHGVPEEVSYKDYLHYRKRCLEFA